MLLNNEWLSVLSSCKIDSNYYPSTCIFEKGIVVGSLVCVCARGGG